MQVRGRLALITGGAGGIGKALARRLLGAGASVALWDLDPTALEIARRELSGLGPVRTQALDLTDRSALAEAASRLRREAGEVDLLDNNAGVAFSGDFLSCPEESLLKTVEVNLNAVMWCTREFLPAMIRRGSGHVVFMSSAAGLLGVPGLAVYSATKHAVIGLAESVRQELAREGHKGIGWTIVCPSFVKTGMFEGVRPPRLVPWLSPEEVAEAVFEAVLKNRLTVRIPFMVRILPALKGLSGPRVLDRIGELLGMTRATEGWKGR